MFASLEVLHSVLGHAVKLKHPLYGLGLSLVVLMTSVGVRAESDMFRRNRAEELAAASNQIPVSYIYGSVVEESIIRDRSKYATNIRFQPRHASELFTQSVLFCGNRSDLFNGLDGPVVVTYGRVAHKMVKDVPCFDLLSVDRVESSGESVRSAR